MALLIDNVPQFLAPRLGRAPDEPFRTHIRATDPDRDYLLIAADPVSMPDWPGDGGGADGEVRMPSEALLRLAYGRLDPGHTPAEVEADSGRSWTGCAGSSPASDRLAERRPPSPPGRSPRTG